MASPRDLTGTELARAAVERFLEAFGVHDLVLELYLASLAGLDPGVVARTVGELVMAESLPTPEQLRAECEKMNWVVMNEGFSGDQGLDGVKIKFPGVFWDHVPTPSERLVSAREGYTAALAAAERLGVTDERALQRLRRAEVDLAEAGDDNELAVLDAVEGFQRAEDGLRAAVAGEATLRARVKLTRMTTSTSAPIREPSISQVARPRSREARRTRRAPARAGPDGDREPEPPDKGLPARGVS